ncbi:MAG: RuBisCO accumulation factor 1 [Microcystaceae cyanobacterium]
MSDLSSEHPLSEENIQQLLQSLLHKEGTWVDWGKTCQKLQKSGYPSQKIFEETGFQGSQQNLIIVAAQVYESLVAGEIDEAILQYFQGPKSDILYEFRILNQKQRVGASELAYDKKIDVDGAKIVAKALQDWSRLRQRPAQFSDHPGDTVAYQCWHQARQKKDLQDRSRLIAKGLKFAHSMGAREAIERLLSDFTVVSSHPTPLLPLYRLEMEEELARIVPVVEMETLTLEALLKIPNQPILEPFRLMQVPSAMTVVPLPGWQAVLKADNPVAITCKSDKLPNFPDSQSEEVLVVIDRGNTEWDAKFYYLVEEDQRLQFQWFDSVPSVSILGQVIVVLRAKRILDENNLLEPWQMDD